MRKSLFEEPSATTASPLLSLLPSLGDVSQLEKYSASFFARLEKVEGLKESATQEQVEGEDREMERSLDLEIEMLKEVLAWTSGRIEEG